MQIEKLLKIASDSTEFGSFNDGLSMMLGAEERKLSRKMLSDDELDLVAGGVNVNNDFELIERLKKSVLKK